jgi:hypothetical protein
MVEADILLSEMLSPYQNFKYALKSKDVQRQYPSLLGRFLNFLRLQGDMEARCNQLYKLGKENSQLLQSHLLKYCMFHKERTNKNEISEGTLRNYLKPLKLFFEMNDIILPWKKIIKGLPSPKQAADDRCPTVEEIRKLLLDFPDRRLKIIVLVMLSSGIRVGAWNWLKWKHVEPIHDDQNNNELLAAKLEVYAGEDDGYFTFITPEAFTALKDYMEFRKLHGENITGDSWLIRDTWQKIDKRHGHRIGLAKFPKKMDSEGIRRMIYDAWKVQGVIEKLDTGNKSHDFKSSHGFRKFFQTHTMQVMYSSNVELLMGHSSSMGLKKNYYKPTEKMLLNDYLKAVDLLTISNTSLKLEKQVKELSEKSKDNEYVIKAKLAEKDQEVLDLKKLDRTKEKSLAALSDKVMKLMKEVQNLKKQKQ